jgi:uncharacterized membrane protein
MKNRVEQRDAGNRLYPLDALRGLAIVVMALDHANFFIAHQHSPGEYWGAPFPEYDSALPFLTRFVTHFAAPGFFFLMGVGMLLFAQARWRQGWSVGRIMVHFWIRGMLLIALQFLVENPLWKAVPGFFPETFIGVLTALGGTMIVGSFLFRLEPIALVLLTLGLLLGTELTHPGPALWSSISHERWRLVLLYSGGDGEFWSTFNVLPWLELVVFGMLFGRWLLADEKQAYQKGFWIGIALLVLFAILRTADGFGNIRPREGETWIDFLNVVKYPPSLTFTFLTMGVNLIILWGFSQVGRPSTPARPWMQTCALLGWPGRASSGRRFQTASKPLVAFGSAPLFVYVLHLILYMLMGRWFEPLGTSLPAMYLYWLAGLAILYLPALWYGRFKHAVTPLRAITAYL